MHPNLRGATKLQFTPPNIQGTPDHCDLVFLATPHGYSKDVVPALVEQGVKIIDLSADFRLREPKAYAEWYGWEHPNPDLLNKSVYGVPELHRNEIRNSNLIACGGCMATASILALAPLVKAELIDVSRIIIDAKIGSSGGGSSPSYAGHHPERFGGVRPYKTVGHRHTVEIEQELGLICGSNVRVGFTPHAVNAARGILSTCHVWTMDPISDRAVWKAYRSFYDDEPFIRFVKSNKGLYQLPDPKVVQGTNFCDIGFMADTHVNRIVAFSAIDNIVKGAAGQGVQCLNVMLGLDEMTALNYYGLH